MGRYPVLSRAAAVLGVSAIVTSMMVTSASAADGDVTVVNTETIQVFTSPTGKVETSRVYEQLDLTGTGSVELRNPVSTDGLRNLDGFGGWDVTGDDAVINADVQGEKRLRAVSDYDQDLPLSVQVVYTLDGKRVEPGDVVGESGTLEVQYTVKNLTGKQQEVTFADGKGGTTTQTVEVPIPIVGSLTTIAPPNFQNVRSDQANVAGDGKGGTKLSFTMTLFPPIGSTTAVFGYTADIVDGVIPRAEISALPVNPLKSPSFSTAASSYEGGASTGAELTDGATQIDGNLLKLRDGAADLLAGLIKLRDGSSALEAGLVDSAAPGSRKLADGAGDLDSGLGLINAGARRLADGTGEAYAGSAKLKDGLGRLDVGANDLSEGLGRARAGSRALAEAFNNTSGKPDFVNGAKDLAAGLRALSDGLDQLADPDAGLPAAADGSKALREGVLRILAGVDNPNCDLDNPKDPTNPCGLVQGLELLTAPQALPAAVEGAKTIDSYVKLLNKIVPAASGAVAGAHGALANTLGDSGTIAKVKQALAAAKTTDGCINDTSAPSCIERIDGALTALGGTEAYVTGASNALGQVTTPLEQGTAIVQGMALKTPDLVDGLVRAEAGAQGLLDGAELIRDGAAAADLKNKLDSLVAGLTFAASQVVNAAPTAERGAAGADLFAAKIALAGVGAGDLADGLVIASDGSLQLADGADDAAAGAGDLSDGLGQIDDGANELADGTGTAKDGSAQLADGAGQLADGLGAAADGSSKLREGLGQAADGAPQLVDGASRLSDEGTKKLIEAGEGTAQNYGALFATMQAGAERADKEDMAFGAPEGAVGLTAYSFVIQGEDGESGRNVARGLGGLAVLGAGAGVFALRRRFI